MLKIKVLTFMVIKLYTNKCARWVFWIFEYCKILGRTSFLRKFVITREAALFSYEKNNRKAKLEQQNSSNTLKVCGTNKPACHIESF